MRQHLRMDGVKVFKEDDKRLQLVMTKYNLTNKSEAYRKSLEMFEEYSNIVDAMHKTISVVEISNDKLEELYFKIDTINNK